MAVSINGTAGVTFNDGTSMSTGQQACKAWVNFNGTGTVAIRAAFNVSSITDGGTGDYRVNFTNAMPDANYAASLTSGNIALGAGNNALTYTAQTYETSALRTQAVVTSTATAADLPNANVAIFR